MLAVVACVAGPVNADDPTDDVVRYENGRLTVRAMNAPLDRLLGQIAAATGATIRGGMPNRTGSFDFTDRPLSDALSRMLGSESFMLTYAPDGSLRTIRLLGRGEAVVAVASPAPAPSPGPAPAAPLAAEEQQAAILQQQVIVTDHPPLRRALGTTLPSIGQVLHATTREANPNARGAAREVALKEFRSSPEVEAAYLSTLEPVDDATLAKMMQSPDAPPGAAREWLQALAASAPSPALRAKATAVLKVLKP